MGTADAVLSVLRQRMVEAMKRGETIVYGYGHYDQITPKDISNTAFDHMREQMDKALADGDMLLVAQLYQTGREQAIREYAIDFADKWVAYLAEAA